MDYKQKLIQFNSTKKYASEVSFLFNMMCPATGDKILDYGCGLGRTVRMLRLKYGAQAYGYDVNNYREEDDEHLFRQAYHFSFDKIYFMHSFAHIPDVDDMFYKIDDWALKRSGQIYVITPNRAWTDLLKDKNPGYMPDRTVARHYTIDELEELFLSKNFSIINIGQFGEVKQGINERLFIHARNR